jgi:hypothetical protein
MSFMVTDQERRVVDILVKCGEVHDCWTEPIHVVDELMGWDTASTRKFVDDLFRRNIIDIKLRARD